MQQPPNSPNPFYALAHLYSVAFDTDEDYTFPASSDEIARETGISLKGDTDQ